MSPGCAQLSNCQRRPSHELVAPLCTEYAPRWAVKSNTRNRTRGLCRALQLRFARHCWRRSVSCPRRYRRGQTARAGAAKARRQRQTKCQSRCSAHSSHTTRETPRGRSSSPLLRHDGETSGVERRSRGDLALVARLARAALPQLSSSARIMCPCGRKSCLAWTQHALGACSSSAEEQHYHAA